MLIPEEAPNNANYTVEQFFIDVFRAIIPFDHKQNGWMFMFFSKEDISIKLVSLVIESFEWFYVEKRMLDLDKIYIFQIIYFQRRKVLLCRELLKNIPRYDFQIKMWQYFFYRQVDSVVTLIYTA